MNRIFAIILVTIDYWENKLLHNADTTFMSLERGFFKRVVELNCKEALTLLVLISKQKSTGHNIIILNFPEVKSCYI